MSDEWTGHAEFIVKGEHERICGEYEKRIAELENLEAATARANKGLAAARDEQRTRIAELEAQVAQGRKEYAKAAKEDRRYNRKMQEKVKELEAAQFDTAVKSGVCETCKETAGRRADRYREALVRVKLRTILSDHGTHEIACDALEDSEGGGSDGGRE